MGKVAMAVAMVVGAAACAVAVAVHRRMENQRNWERVIRIVKDLEDSCETPIERLMEIANAMVDDMNAGLALDGGSSVKMLISFVDNLPSGGEKGLFYALDLGGTNFSVLRFSWVVKMWALYLVNLLKFRFLKN